jgi:hypothetical protein
MKFATPHLCMLAALACPLYLTACLSSAPIVPETAANQDQIATCQATAELHNGVVVGDFVLGGAAPALGAVAAALPNGSGKTDLGITAAVTAGVLAVGATLVGYTASNFAASNCSSVVGQLPTPPVTIVVSPDAGATSAAFPPAVQK